MDVHLSVSVRGVQPRGEGGDSQTWILGMQRLIRQDEGVFEMLFSGSGYANLLDALAYYGRLSDISGGLCG